MDHRALRFPDLPAEEPRRLPEALRDPLRLTILGGLLILGLGTVMPWMVVWLPGRGQFDVSGFERAGDAGILLELGLLALALTWSSQAWHSRTAILVAGPLGVGLACVILLRVTWTDAMAYFASLANAGGYGSILPWFWVAVAGALIVTAGGAVAVWRARERVSFRFGLTRAALGGTIGGLAGAALGFISGVTIAELFTAGDIAWVSTSVVVLLSMLLAFLGAWAGAMAGASIGRSLGR
jgi:hypothetical protein